VNVRKFRETFQAVHLTDEEMRDVIYCGFAPGNDFPTACEAGIRRFCSLPIKGGNKPWVDELAKEYGCEVKMCDVMECGWDGILYSDAQVTDGGLQRALIRKFSKYIIKCNYVYGEDNPYRVASELLNLDPAAEVFKVPSSRKSNEEVFVTNLLPSSIGRGWKEVIRGRDSYISELRFLMRLDFPIVSDKVLPITDKAFNLQVPHTGS
jgi:hypothetical protein